MKLVWLFDEHCAKCSWARGGTVKQVVRNIEIGPYDAQLLGPPDPHMLAGQCVAPKHTHPRKDVPSGCRRGLCGSTRLMHESSWPQDPECCALVVAPVVM